MNFQSLFKRVLNLHGGRVRDAVGVEVDEVGEAGEGHGTRRDKSLPQCMEALWAGDVSPKDLHGLRSG